MNEKLTSKLKCLCLVIILFLTGVTQSSARVQGPDGVPVVPASLEKAMQFEKVIPDLLSTVPKQTLQITYLPGTVVHLGNELGPAKVRSSPRQITWTADSTKLYTLIFLDIDAPHRQTPRYRSLLNWLIVNIPGSDLMKGDIRAEYIGAGPPKDSGIHRMVYLILEQTEKLPDNGKIINNRSIDGRYSFKLEDFIADNNLISVPVAGNFFVSRFDNYVPVLQGQLGLNRR